MVSQTYNPLLKKCFCSWQTKRSKTINWTSRIWKTQLGEISLKSKN